MLIENIPIFTEDVDKKITASTDGEYNFILKGDNLQSLYLLERTHRGTVDLIYIDSVSFNVPFTMPLFGILFLENSIINKSSLFS